MRYILIFCFITLAGCQNWVISPELDSVVSNSMEVLSINALSVGHVKSDGSQVIYNFGFRNADKTLTVDQDSAYMFASVSKIITAGLVLHASEAGLWILMLILAPIYPSKSGIPLCQKTKFPFECFLPTQPR